MTPAHRRTALLQWIAVHSLAIAAALFFVLPFVFVFLTSLMTDQQALTRDLVPGTWVWENYARVWNTPGFLTWWRNTLLYAGLGTLLTVASSIPVAYALATFRFRGQRLAMLLVIAMMMLPPQVVIIPMYLFWARQLDLSGTLWPLIIPLAFGDAFSIFLLRQFLLTIPDEYLDAARVDGCGELRALLRVVLPMAKPGIAAVALFSFFALWNDYFGPQIYASDNPGAWTLSYGLESFKGAHHTDWNLTMAATVMVMAPVIVLFFFAQKAFVEGVTLTGVKG
ncbi:carbohydrate ABC transporter permease [Streptomyces sp. NPDC048349]|uniref:carbohydrate ABC transporter permease n=1 Tax=Streptomyces sp. NPDC048349 TaxID=3155486 RepID=UPI0034350939